MLPHLVPRVPGLQEGLHLPEVLALLQQGDRVVLAPAHPSQSTAQLRFVSNWIQMKQTGDRLHRAECWHAVWFPLLVRGRFGRPSGVNGRQQNASTLRILFLFGAINKFLLPGATFPPVRLEHRWQDVAVAVAVWAATAPPLPPSMPMSGVSCHCQAPGKVASPVLDLFVFPLVLRNCGFSKVCFASKLEALFHWTEEVGTDFIKVF